MNEELRIIIRAVSDDAQRNLAEVRAELERIQGSGNKTGATVDAALGAMAKGAAAAVAAVTALTAAMKSLGQAAQDVQKGFAKLNTTFMNAGSTTKQASQTYKELFSFLGDHDKAVETAQSLALITNEEAKLTEWTYTLQGAFAQMGDKLPIEGLAEAANETINVGQVTGVLADALNWAGVSEDAFNQALAQTNSLSEREALVRGTLNGLYGNSAKLYEQNNQATKQYNESQANLNITLASAAAYTTPLLTALNNLSTTLLTSFGPALQTIAIYLTAFIQLLAEAAQWVGSFFGMFSGGSDGAVADIDGYRAAVKAYQEALRNSLNGTNGELKEELSNINAIKKATMGFDELNIVSKPASSPSIGGGGGSTGGGSLPAAPNPEDFGLGVGAMDMSAMTESIAEAKEYLKGALVLVGLIGTGLLGWKVGNIISDFKGLKGEISDIKEVWNQLTNDFEKEWNMPAPDNKAAQEAQQALKDANKELDAMKKKWMTIGGTIMAAVGAVMLVVGFSDAWVNGLDWKNFALILGGIGLAVGGIAMAFGPIAAAIALVVGGIAALVIGIKDLVTNGYSMEGVLMVLAGAIAVAVGIMWAFNAALLANPITWIVVAIAALVAAFVILWNECDAFRQFWIDLWNGIVDAFWAVVEWIKNAFNTVVNFFKENWQALLLLLVNPFAGAFKLLYDNCDGFREFIDKWVAKIGQFFKDLWEGIKSVFSSVGTFFKDVFTKAWEGVKNVFSKGGKIFDGIKEGIVSTFKVVVNGLIDGINKVVKLPFEGLNGILNTIHRIEIVGVKPFDWLTWRAPVPQLPKLATGGITTGTTIAMIGEAGKEAVLPLENNTGWMDSLADRIASRNATPTKIVLQLDGKELGWANINSINSITKQTGTLQLVMA